MLDQRKHIVDDDLMLRASAVLATAAYCTYGAATPVTLDLGGGFTEGKMVVDVSAVDKNFATSGSNQIVDFIIRASNRSSFDGGFVPLARFRLGSVFAAESVKDSGLGGASSGTTQTGRFVTPWTNDFGGTIYQYIRVRVLFAGTFQTGITFSAFMTKK